MDINYDAVSLGEMGMGRDLNSVDLCSKALVILLDYFHWLDYYN